MIIDTNFLGGMLKATDKAIAGPSDADLEMPDTLLPVIEPLLPTDFLGSATVPAESSFITLFSTNHSNAIAGAANICTLNRGLWTLDTFINYSLVGTAGVYVSNAWTFYISYQGYTAQLLSDSIYSAALQKSTVSRRFRILLRSQATLGCSWIATAIGERIAFDGSIIGTKHL